MVVVIATKATLVSIMTDKMQTSGESFGLCRYISADHCSVFALSDVSDSSFKQHCNHNHDELCAQCNALDVPIDKIGTVAQNVVFSDEGQRDEVLFLFEAAKRSIEVWKAHQLQSVQQDKSRLDAL